MKKMLLNTLFCLLFTVIFIESLPVLSSQFRPWGRGAREFSENILSNAPKDAVIFTGSIDPLSTLLYLQNCENFRTDVVIISRNRWGNPQYRALFAEKFGWSDVHQGNPKEALLKAISTLSEAGFPLLWEGLDRREYNSIHLTPFHYLFKLESESKNKDREGSRQEKRKSSGTLPEIEDLESLAARSDLLGQRVIANVMFNLSLYVLEKGEQQKAKELLKIALRIDRDNSPAISNLISLLGVEGRYEEALKLFNYYEGEIFANSDFCYNSAVLQTVVGNTQKAGSLFQKAALLQPDSWVRWAAYGENLMNQNHYSPALDALHQAVMLNPDYLDGLYYMAVAYYSKGNTEKAREFCQKILEKKQDHDFARRFMELLETKSKQKK